MNILIDARLMRINKNGPSSYARNMLLNLSKVDKINNYTVLVNKENFNFINATNFQIITLDIKPYRLREHWAIPKLLKNKQYDLYHCMQYVAPLLINCPTVLTIYDTMHMEKHFWDDTLNRRIAGKYLRLLSKLSVKKSVAIVTISQYSANQIVKEFGYDMSRIYSIYLGVNSSYFNRNRDADTLYSMQKWKIANPYLLCIGNMRPYKNIDVLIKAFSELVNEGYKDVSLVLAGKPSDEDMFEKKRIVSSLNLQDKVIFIRNMNEKDMVALMGGASIFLFPSRNEGFGLPLLEATATGAPCIVSNIEVFRELCGESVLYFEPNDSTTLKKKIIELLLSNQLKEKMKLLAVQNAKKYSWENTAKKTILMYEEIVSKIGK